ncbi:MAG: restriction endonuclease subunit S [Rikenellaceae bacterium]|nr:restriction endonuclease subunit S [Rikenellaceae bacterium]MBR0339775.1 restriction endonuclease subunit S [Alistipes sp.]
MTSWKTYRLGDICKRVCSGGTPKSTEPSYYDGDIPWLNTKEINFNRIYSTERCITQKGLDNSSAKWIDANCVIVAMYGATAAKVAINKIPLTTNQACCNLSIDEKIADYNYVYYWLCANYTELASLANGGAQQNLNAQQIKDFEISLPSLEEQRRIAGILGAIDDKIENNRRINTNLELQAQALFDKIFFDDKGVERNPLSNYANINPTRTLRQGVVARYIEMANLPTKGSFPSDWSYKSYGGGCKFANGDTIMARITPCLENGKTAYIDFLEEQEVAFGSTEYIVISAKSGYCPALFYFLARNKEFVDYAVGHMNGSSGRQRVGGVDIANFPMPHISLEDSNKFAEIAMPIMDVISNNSLENRQLATLRDTLLPKLMNGEIKL